MHKVNVGEKGLCIRVTTRMICFRTVLTPPVEVLLNCGGQSHQAISTKKERKETSF